nr:hypothetical protein [Kofleriaceae bacterium]
MWAPVLATLLLAACGAASTASSPSTTPSAALTNTADPTAAPATLAPVDPHDRVLAMLRARGIAADCVALEDEDQGVIAVRERHAGRCPGDPQTSPVVGRYRVVADKLETYDVATDTWQ